jgi:dTDP-4-dehydrorhamnose reductase
MRRVLITGASGHLGLHLLRQAPPDWEVHGVGHTRRPSAAHAWQADLADAGQVTALVAASAPALIIHTAYRQHEPETAIVAATRHLAEAAAAVGAGFIYVSSDMVFSGAGAPYAEDAPPRPTSTYGAAKATAERLVAAHLPEAAIVRCSLIVGLDPLNASTAWIVERLRAGQPVELYVDELRTPIAAPDLAAALWELAGLSAAARAGVWHLASPEALSRYALGLLLARRLGLPAALVVPAEAPPDRPRDLRLATARATAQLRCRPRPLSAFLAP